MIFFHEWSFTRTLLLQHFALLLWCDPPQENWKLIFTNVQSFTPELRKIVRLFNPDFLNFGKTIKKNLFTSRTTVWCADYSNQSCLRTVHHPHKVWSLVPGVGSCRCRSRQGHQSNNWRTGRCLAWIWCCSSWWSWLGHTHSPLAPLCHSYQGQAGGI